MTAILEREQVTGRRMSIMIAVGLASMMLPLTVTGTAVALTDMATDLNASSTTIQWVLNAYNVTFAACLLAAGSMADQFGRKRVMLIGVWTYVAMSVVCAVANNVLLIDLARGVQGIGAAAILTGGAGVLAATFQGAERAKAFGILGTSFGFGLALGPLAAGVLTDLANWRAFFLLNVLAGLGVLLLIRHVRESNNPEASHVDWGGLITFSGSLFLLALGFVEGPQRGWDHPVTLGSLIGSVAFMIAFVQVERRSHQPMFDLSLFKRPTFVVVVSQPFTIVFGFVILVVFLPPYLQGVDGYSAAAAGAILLPLMLPVFALPMLAGVIASKVPLRIMLAASSLLIALGSLWLVTLQPGDSWTALIGPLLVFGIGVGSAFGVMDNAAVSVVPVARAGMAAGIFNTMRITGESVAVAGTAALLSSITLNGLLNRAPGLTDEQSTQIAGDAYQGRIDDALATVPPGQRAGILPIATDSLTSGLHITFLVLAALALAGAITTFLVIKDKELTPSS